MSYSRLPLILSGIFAATLSVLTSCQNETPAASSAGAAARAATGPGGQSAQGSSAGAPGSAASGVTNASGAGASSATNTAASGSTKPITAGASAPGGTSAGAIAGAAAGSGNASGAGAPAPGKLAPSVRNPKYASLAPPLGEPIPSGMPGMWSWVAVDGALSRDGTPAGFYAKFSSTGSKNLLIYLAGGGVCADNFFCNMNPPNKDSSLTAENVGSGVFNIFGPTQEAQDPTLERWQSGIFKNDPANPAHDWNMIFIPYVTGDIFFGSKPNGTIPEVEGSTFQFVGKTNMQKFIGRIVPTFKDAQIVVLAGSSAGGIGALLNSTYVFDAFIDQGNGARGFLLDDAGPFFDDPYIEVCMQKRYRDLYGLDESFPAECATCKSADGGHIAAGLLSYLFDKYPDNVLGGLVDSDQDEIMKFFFSEGL